MTWSERSELRVSSGAYTFRVRIQTIHKDCFVRYTSYERLFDSRSYFGLVRLLFDSRSYFGANETFIRQAQLF